jgi:hypothetical protein
MLTHNWIELLDLELLGHCPLILGCRVKMACISARYQLDLIAHTFLLNRFTACPHLCQHHVNASFINRPQSMMG